jgi:hypothetical protein
VVRLLIAAALVVTGVSVASATTHNLNEICEWKARGIAAATPCLAKVMRLSAAENEAKGYPRAASIQRTYALHIEVIAEKRRAGEISEEKAVEEFNVSFKDHQEKLKKAFAQDDKQLSQQPRAVIINPGPIQGLERDLAIGRAMNPACTKWGVC